MLKDNKIMLVCFFFQAEDGIRAGRVTGVQTCALPITYAPATPDEDEDLVDTTGENPVPVPYIPPPRPSSYRAASSPPSGAKPKDPLTANQCEYCGGGLPGNREARFCPHCGQPQEGDLRCQGCGSELDVGWAYCLACGRPTGFE